MMGCSHLHTIADQIDQARTVFGYVRGFLEASPALAREVIAVKRQEIELRNGIVIAVHSNSYRTVRGRTMIGCVLDEVSFWRDESTATPDTETYTAILPSLATTNGMLVGISTPYRPFVAGVGLYGGSCWSWQPTPWGWQRVWACDYDYGYY